MNKYIVLLYSKKKKKSITVTASTYKIPQTKKCFRKNKEYIEEIKKLNHRAPKNQTRDLDDGDKSLLIFLVFFISLLGRFSLVSVGSFILFYFLFYEFPYFYAFKLIMTTTAETLKLIKDISQTRKEMTYIHNLMYTHTNMYVKK